MSFNVQAALCFPLAPWVNAKLICPCFPRRRVLLIGISGYMARKSGSKVVGTLDPEPGSWDLGSGTWKLKPGTQSISIFPGSFAGGRAAVFSALRQGTNDCRGLTCGLGPGPAGTKDCRGLTCGLGPGPAETEDCRAWCYPPLERCFQPGGPWIWLEEVVSCPQLRLSAAGDIFLPFNMCPGSGHDVFHGLALIFGQLLIDVPVGEQTSLEGGDGSGDAAFGNGYLLLIEAGYIASQGFHPMLEDFIETIRGFLQVPAAGELFYELAGTTMI
ncbi:hypothetical protein F2Q68_00004567 [Brassica cretica]|uniref:Uncharacterized protein n=2 Tax=Brassica cretica TaxID=69181 RepID=A0ABQ7BSD7_BRACR|nr:hypothetical protein F2Q68_00004567 [Brassica cretica]KAF3542399.1 hypothetical protein DY000_02006719 [Brassica cretica]